MPSTDHEFELDADPAAEKFHSPADFSGVLPDHVAEARARHQRMVSDSSTLAGLSRELLRVQLAADRRVSDAVEAERKRREEDVSRLQAEKERLQAQLQADKEALQAQLDLFRNELSTTALAVHQAARSEALALSKFPAQVASEGMKLLEDMRKPPPPGTNGFDVMRDLGGQAIDRFGKLAEKLLETNPEVAQKLRGFITDASGEPEAAAAPAARSHAQQLPQAQSDPTTSSDLPAGFATVKVFQVLGLLNKVAPEEQARFFSGLGVQSIDQATCKDLLLFWDEFHAKAGAEASTGAA